MNPENFNGLNDRKLKSVKDLVCLGYIPVKSYDSLKNAIYSFTLDVIVILIEEQK